MGAVLHHVQPHLIDHAAERAASREEQRVHRLFEQHAVHALPALAQDGVLERETARFAAAVVRAVRAREDRLRQCRIGLE